MYLQHVKSGLFIHPANHESDAAIGSPLVMHSALLGPSGLFRFLSDGNIQHVQSGYFVSPSKGVAKTGEFLALHPDGPKPEYAFELDGAGCLRHCSSGLFVHPESGKGAQGRKIMLHKDGPDRAFPGEIAFKFESKSSAEQFVAIMIAQDAAAKAAADAEAASAVFCDEVESLWAAVLAGCASSDSAHTSAVARILSSQALNKANIIPHNFVPVQLFKLLTESALNVTLPSTNPSPTHARIVECVRKCLLLKPLAKMRCEHLLDGLFDPTQEFISDEQLREACSDERARPTILTTSWTIRSAMERDRGRFAACMKPVDLLSHLRTDCFSAKLTRHLSSINPMCVFAHEILASVCSSFPSCLAAIFCLAPFAVDISSAEMKLDPAIVMCERLACRSRNCSSLSPDAIQHALEAFGFRDADFNCSLADAALVVECVAKSPDVARNQILRSMIRSAVDSGVLVSCSVCLDWVLRRHTVVPCKCR